MDPRKDTLCYQWFTRVWNDRDESAIDQLLDEFGVSHGLAEQGSTTVGPAGFKSFWRQFVSAFPDIRFEVDEAFTNGAMEGILWTCTATHQGEGIGIAPTGRKIKIKGLGMARVRGKRIVECWNGFDQLGLLQQLGAVHLYDPAHATAETAGAADDPGAGTRVPWST